MLTIISRTRNYSLELLKKSGVRDYIQSIIELQNAQSKVVDLMVETLHLQIGRNVGIQASLAVKF